ncbi:hypothetical protein HanXRQr2_Chr01g0016111 [Helianthus annuus]|uniref:Uncharacterized protein n=1 Tax=Helianthus annuus TaxID=4232 RepID=A0A251VMZ9_HELAN|nr:uncharacterized protein LOC110868449 [Helianthus annuus]XP_035832948.1 uncharacterized protein LOC110868449 [Helianthus annuus]KAF5821617.1 hypothetical protein HanXRQr2_Chr01g0016111 [Helianthus annuus]KAJ0622246.1 hypothetical protein HanIR_Chr01g0017841 [Helianthus annuus]KAJ0956491.1 hypothetical protein HanPSC8_Chr01g0015431 [Helianthus annuus]
MGDPISARSKHGQTLRSKFELENRRLSYTDFHYQEVKARLQTAASPSNQTEVGNRDEIVRHMSNLPSYLETRKDTSDKALNFGVMDWGKLQKWQYQHVYKCSPSSSYSSPLTLTARSTPQSTVGQRYSYSDQRPPRVTLQSYFNASSSDTGNYTSSAVSSKGKMKIEDPFHRTRDVDEIERRKTIVCSPMVSHVNSETDVKSRSYQKSNTFEVKRPPFSSKKSDLNTGNVTASKLRNMSPIRRFGFGNTKRTESPVSQRTTTDNNNTRVSTRSQSSPLRRIFEPLFHLKATNSRQCMEEDSKVKAISKLDPRNDTCEPTSTRQALFQSVVKNGRPLFTFAIENNNNVLAATVRDLSSSGKDNSSHWIYTFFTVDEIKKKNWLSNSRKDKGHGYAPNVTAQMTVTNRSIYNSDTREFSLFRVNPYDEHAAIVVKFSRNVENEEDQERFSTTVILPGGNHGVASNGKPSPLTDRWRSGGICDCGGWDLGCRLRTLTNQVQSSGRSNSPNGQFELFFQGDVMNNQHFFNLCPIKEGIFSVEYNSSVSPLQAFAICISVVECRKSSQHQESTTYVAKRVTNDPNSVRFASFPPLSPVGRV